MREILSRETGRPVKGTLSCTNIFCVKINNASTAVVYIEVSDNPNMLRDHH